MNKEQHNESTQNIDIYQRLKLNMKNTTMHVCTS